MTQEFLQDAIVEDLKQLFSHYTLTNSLGVERAVKIVPQGLPIREGDDEETDAEAPPEPYVAVKLSDGEVTAQDARQTVNVVMVICVCDPDPNRQGYRDALHIVNEIVRHYERDGIVANRYEAQHPIRWATRRRTHTRIISPPWGCRSTRRRFSRRCQKHNGETQKGRTGHHRGLLRPVHSGRGEAVHRIHQRDPHRAGGGYREAASHGGPGGAPGAVTGGHEEPAERHGAYFPPVSSGTGQTLNRR